MSEQPAPSHRRHCLGLLLAGGCCAVVGAGVAGHAAAFLMLEDAATLTVRQFDRDGLRMLPQTAYVTGTVWTEAVNRYTGVLLRDLLLEAGVDPEDGDGTVTVMALDGYSATLAFGDITDVAPMLAYLRDGAEMPQRAQGPFWLIYPFDADDAFRTETTYARSVWQVTRLLVER